VVSRDGQDIPKWVVTQRSLGTPGLRCRFVCRLLRIGSRPTPRLTESPFVNLFIGPVNSYPRRLSIVLRTRTIKFKGIIFQGGSFRTVHGG